MKLTKSYKKPIDRLLAKKSLEILESQLERELQEIQFRNEIRFKRERGKPIKIKKI